MLPHTPYIFDADGSFIRNPDSSKRSQRDEFAAQLEYTNHRLLAIVDHLLDRPVEATDDHHPGRRGSLPGWGSRARRATDWMEAMLEEREVKFNILNSWDIRTGGTSG